MRELVAGNEHAYVRKNVLLESRPCPLGCPGPDEPVLKGHDRLLGLAGEYMVVRCTTCGLMRTNPRPTQESIGYYYPDNYSPYKSIAIREGNFPSSIFGHLKTSVQGLIRFNSTRIPNLDPGRMLEIGCASGAFLEKMARKGWYVEGIELSRKASERARAFGHKIINAAVEDAPDPLQLYDLIVGWMVLEHLHDPVGVLKKLRRWVKADGWFVFSVPNADSFEFKLFRERWYALHLPNHLYHYTPNTLEKVLNKGGWEMVRVFHQRTSANLIGSIGYWLANRNRLKLLAEKMKDYPEKARVLSYLLFPVSFILALFGQTGRMTVWARREDD